MFRFFFHSSWRRGPRKSDDPCFNKAGALLVHQLSTVLGNNIVTGITRPNSKRFLSTPLTKNAEISATEGVSGPGTYGGQNRSSPHGRKRVFSPAGVVALRSKLPCLASWVWGGVSGDGANAPAAGSICARGDAVVASNPSFCRINVGKIFVTQWYITTATVES